MPAELERLAFAASERALDQQERLVDELRNRAGVLLASASLAASFLGREAFGGSPSTLLAAISLAAFLVAVVASVYVLLPRANAFVFSVVSGSLYDGLYPARDNPPEIYRTLAFNLDAIWASNDRALQPLFHCFRLAAASLTVEILVLIAMVGDTLA